MDVTLEPVTLEEETIFDALVEVGWRVRVTR